MHEGSCQCSAVRYKFKGEPLTCYSCHCTDCQTSSGSAFGLSMIVNEKDIELTKGEFSIQTTEQNGMDIKRHHCSQCGTAFGYSADAYPNIIALKPGTFEDTSWFKPIAHLWVRSAQSWVVFDTGTPKYEKQPELAELLELWSKRKT